MTLSEKVAYLRGLEAGLNLNAERPETKMFNAIIDILGEMASSADEQKNYVEELTQQVDAIDVDLSELESLLFSEEDWTELEGDDSLLPLVEEYDEEDEFEFDPDEDMYEVVCPSCGEVLYVDVGILEEGGIDCPSCGEKLEFDIEVEEPEEAASDEPKAD